MSDNKKVSGSMLSYAIDKMLDLLDTKHDTLTFDTIPAEGSNNPVTSEGIKVVLNTKQDRLDTLTWTPSTLPSNTVWQEVAYGNGMYVAITTGSNKTAYSTDGITWTETTNLPSESEWYSITYGNGKFVAVAYGTAGAYSTDGINWTAITFPVSRNRRSVTYGNGKFIVVSTSTDVISYSTDGINWSDSNLPSSGSWYSVTYGNGMFVAVANTSDMAAYSTDGINWSATTLPTNTRWYSVTYGNGKFVAVATNVNIAAYSMDGIHWSESTLPVTGSWRSVTYGNGIFVTISYNSTVSIYSTDGINWTEVELPYSTYWRTVTYGGNGFVAIGFSSDKAACAKVTELFASRVDRDAVTEIVEDELNTKVDKTGDIMTGDLTIDGGTESKSFVVKRTVDDIVGKSCMTLTDVGGKPAAGLTVYHGDNAQASLYVRKGLMTFYNHMNGNSYEMLHKGNVSTVIEDALEDVVTPTADTHAANKKYVDDVAATKAPLTHASQHKAGGADALAPADIGAVPVGYYSGDMNDLITDGHYRVSTNANLPGAAYYGQVIVVHGGSAYDTMVQLAISYNQTRMFLRGGSIKSTDVTWNDWKELATTDYAVNKAGDIMTGGLILQGSKPYTEAGWTTSPLAMRDSNSQRTGWLGVLTKDTGEVQLRVANDVGSIMLYPSNGVVQIASNGEQTVLHTGNKNLITPADIGAESASRPYISNVDILSWATSKTAPTKAICGTDVTNMPTAGGYWMVDLEYAPNGIWYQLIVTEIFTLAKYENICNNGTWTGWYTVGNSLPLDGSKNMTGNLIVQKSSYPSVIVKDMTQNRFGEIIYNINEEVIINNTKDSNNRTLLFLRNENNIDGLMQLSRVVNGEWSSYNVLHTGNIGSYSAKIETGTYTGTNGASKSLTFSTTPIMIFIIGSGSKKTSATTYYYEDFAVLHSGGGLYYGKEGGSYTNLSPISVTSFNTTVTFTGKAGGYVSHGSSLNSQTGTTDAGAVMNNSYCTYRYIAFFA